MKQIGSLFKKYKKTLVPPQASVEKEFITVVKTVVGFDLAIESVSYSLSTRTISITAPKLVKQEITLHSEEIIKHLTIKLGIKNTPKFIR